MVNLSERAEFAASLEELRNLVDKGGVSEAWGRLEGLQAPRDADAPDLAERLRRAKVECARKLADSAVAREEADQAEAWRRLVVELAPDVLAFHLDWARALMRVGKPSQAWSVLSTAEASADSPDLAGRVRRAKVECARKLAEFATARNVDDDAEAWRRMVVELAPNAPAYRLDWARALMRVGKLSEAWSVLSTAEASADTPDLAERIRREMGACARKLADLATARKDYDEAEVWRRRVVELAPDAPAFRLDWARALVRAGKPSQAWPVLTTLATSADVPDFAERLRRTKVECTRKLGESAAAHKFYDEAEAWRRRVVELAPDVLAYRLDWAWALMHAGKPSEAWSVLSTLEASADAPDFAERLRRAMGACASRIASHLELRAGPPSVEGTDWRQAVRWRQEAVNRNPDDASSWRRLAFDLVYCGRFDDARAVVAAASSVEIATLLREHIGDMPRHLCAQMASDAFIFRRAAPKYRERGLPVVPALGKVVIPPDWERWGDQLPDESDYLSWCDIPWANIGLVLGRQSGVCVIDIDTNNDELIEVICTLLPRSPWRRIGRRGMALAYRWSGQPTQRCLGDADPYASIFECLSASSHILLPPSLHPQTGLPYRANCELLDALDDLPTLPDGFAENLTAALRTKGCDARLAGPVRDESGIALMG